jgi:hypothetical protein
MMQAVNQAYESLNDYTGSLNSGDDNYSDALNDAINAVINLEGIEIEVCGAWVWVTGDTKQHAKILGRKEGGAGFYYASKKVAWYYRPSDWKSTSRGKTSLDDIRSIHGSKIIEKKAAKKLASA